LGLQQAHGFGRKLLGRAHQVDWRRWPLLLRQCSVLFIGSKDIRCEIVRAVRGVVRSVTS